MSEELKAAVERVRRVLQGGESGESVYGGDPLVVCNRILADLSEVANAYLDAHPANDNDNEPATVEWALSNGGKRDDPDTPGPATSAYWRFEEGVEICIYQSCSCVCIDFFNEGGEMATVLMDPTRRQVRALLSAFRVRVMVVGASCELSG